MKIDWKRKLTSRKFWAAVVGFVTPMIIVSGGSESEATQVAGIIMAGATLIAYIVGEGLVDSNYTEKEPTEIPIIKLDGKTLADRVVKYSDEATELEEE